MSTILIQLEQNELEEIIKRCVREVLEAYSISEDQDKFNKYPEYFGVAEAAQFLGLSKSSIYKFIASNRIAYKKTPNSKRIYFHRIDLVNYINTGQFRSITELREEAYSMIVRQKRKSNLH